MTALNVSTFPTDERPVHTLQSPVHLRQSLLWDLQRNYYDQTGTDAWESGVVPSFITTNTFIARSYVRMVLSYLQYVITILFEFSGSQCCSCVLPSSTTASYLSVNRVQHRYSKVNCGFILVGCAWECQRFARVSSRSITHR